MLQSERKEMTRTAIENAGIECFSRKSFDCVTMDEIAKKSGYTKRTVYNYFPSKTALIASIFARKLEELYNAEENALAKCTTAREVISVHFWELNHFSRKNTSFMQMFWALRDGINTNESTSDVVEMITFWNRKLIDMPSQAIAKKGLTGKLAFYPPVVIIHYVSAINKGLFLQLSKAGQLGLADVSFDELANFALETLLNSLE